MIFYKTLFDDDFTSGTTVLRQSEFPEIAQCATYDADLVGVLQQGSCPFEDSFGFATLFKYVRLTFASTDNDSFNVKDIISYFSEPKTPIYISLDSSILLPL